MFTDEELEEMSILAIYNYYDGEYTKEYIKKEFSIAIKFLKENAKKIMNIKKVSGATSISQGGRSISFGNGIEAFSLTSDILALLPKRKDFRVW